MFVFYDEDGGFKAGSVFSEIDASLMVESLQGRRTKVKAANVLLRFKEPGLAGFMEAAEKATAELDADFLWEVSGQEEFGFLDLARDYYGHEPSAVEAAALVMKLHGSPMYFYKKGKGRYKPATPEILAAAKAGAEKKRLQQEKIGQFAARLQAGELPDEVRAQLWRLLCAPDKNSMEWKALDQACGATGLSPERLLERCRAFVSARDYHLQRFLFEHFPRGTGFDAGLDLAAPPDLPLGDACAFSIDDAATTEIDDAFSVLRLQNGNLRVGVHIAAPALGLKPGTHLDAIAAERLSTVYMPGDKITMLPDGVVEEFTLSAGRLVPALSMYLEVSPELDVVSSRSAVDMVQIVANLRHDTLEPVFNAETVQTGAGDYPFKNELLFLWRFADRLEEGRGRPDANKNFGPEYGFAVEGEHVRILPRTRGTPIDKVVSELMILVNSRWAMMLAENNVAAIYRVQKGGKTRMTTEPAGHRGLGLEMYAWMSSPLRRYVDLLNQRQLVALLMNEPPPYTQKSGDFLSALRRFEIAYGAYADFQRDMERYWSLKYLEQEGITLLGGEVLREELVRLDGVPLVTRVPSLPALEPGCRVELEIGAIDYLDLSFSCRFKRELPTS